MAEVKLSQESYDELLSDIKALRLQADTYFELWQNARLKAEAFDEIVKANDKSDSPEGFGDLVWGILMDYGVIHLEG